MPEVAEPPVETKPTPAAPPGKTSIGDKFREALAKIEKDNTPPKETDRSLEEVKLLRAKPEEVEDKPKPAPKSVSPIDVALGEAKPEPKQEHVEEDFDKIEKPKSDDWKRLKEVKERYRTELEELRKASPKPDPEIQNRYSEAQKEIEGLKITLSERDKAIKAINAEYSDEYRGLMSERDAAMQRAAGRLEMVSTKDKAELLFGALNLPMGKFRSNAIKEIMADLDADDKIHVVNAIEDLQKVEYKIADYRKDLPSKWDEIQQREAHAQREASESALRELKTDFDDIVKEIPNATKFLQIIPDDVDGATKWNGDIKNDLESAYKILNPNGGATRKESIITVIKGKAYDRVEKFALEWRERALAAEARNAEFDRSGPDLKPSPQKPGTSERKLTAAEKYHKAMRELTSRDEESA